MTRFLIHSTLALTLAVPAAFAQQATQAPAATPNAETQDAAPASHQGRFGHHRPFDAHKEAQHLSKKLGLNNDQTAKLEPILSDRQQKMQALRANTSLTEDQRREQSKAIMKDSQAQLATVLTPDQMQQLKSMRHGGPRGRRGGDQQQAPDSTTPPTA